LALLSKFLLATSLVAGAGPGQMDEYRVKAAFLYNFAKFIDWPAEAFRDSGESFTICVLGDDPFGRALDDAATNKTIAGRTLEVRRLSDARQAGGCRILFISSSERKRVLSVVAAAGRVGVLTVGEAGSATCDGVVIKFTLEAGKIRFEINLPAAEEGKLRLSSRLLNLAAAVRK
jgi:hypothetical protein